MDDKYYFDYVAELDKTFLWCDPKDDGPEVLVNWYYGSPDEETNAVSIIEFEGSGS